MDVERDWIVTFAHKVAVERDYSARHPGHVFIVMLNREEAEGLLAQTNELALAWSMTTKPGLIPALREALAALEEQT